MAERVVEAHSVDPDRIEAVKHLATDILATAPALSADDARKHREYLESSAWRYAATLDTLRSAFGRPLEAATVLDVGAYPGHVAALLGRAERATVTAVTLVTSPAFEGQMRGLGVSVAVCDVERNPLPALDRSVDVVLCCELIEHLDGDVRHMLREARRVVRDDGLLLLTTPNHASIANRWALLRGRSVYPSLDDPDYPFYAGPGVRNPMRHVREFTAGEIEALLAQAGFGRIALETASPPPGDGRGLSWRGRAIGRVLRWSQATMARSGALIMAVARP